LEATTAKGKTHNNTAVYEFNPFPWKIIQWKLIAHFLLRSQAVPAVRNVYPYTQNLLHTTTIPVSYCIHVTSLVINLSTNNTALKLWKIHTIQVQSSIKYNIHKWISQDVYIKNDLYKTQNKALRKMRTLMLLLLHSRHGMSWYSAHLRRFGDRCQLRRGTGNSWFQNKGAQTRKLIAHKPTDYCTSKLTPPHGFRDCKVPVATVTLYEGSMEELSFRDNPGTDDFSCVCL
jgi:hypothetical protein